MVQPPAADHWHDLNDLLIFDKFPMNYYEEAPAISRLDDSSFAHEEADGVVTR